MTDSQHSAAGGARTAPLSVGQQAMFVGWQIDPEQWTHIIPLAFDVRGEPDPAQLRTALAAVTRRYPHLLGRVVERAGTAVLDWSAAPEVPVRERHTTEPAEQAARTAWQHPFDLRGGPLVRADVIHHPEGTLLLIAVHHLVCDGASVLTLLHALTRAWAGEELGEPDDPALWAASAARSHALAEDPEGEPHREFWRGYLGADPPAFELPAPLEPPRYQVLGGPLEHDLLARVADVADQLEVSRFTVMFAAFFVLLRRYSGQDRVLACVPFHGRSVPGTRELVGYFANVLPVVQTVSGSDSYAELVARLHRDMGDCLRHGELPLPAVLRAAGLTGPDAHARTHQVVFQWWDAGRHEHVDVRALRLTDPQGASAVLSLRQLESTADFRATLMLRGDKGGLSMLWKDPGATVGPTLLGALSEDYLAVLADLCRHPGRRISELAAVLEPAPGSAEPLFDPAELAAAQGAPNPARTLVAAPAGVPVFVADQDGNRAPLGVPGLLRQAGADGAPALRARTLPGARLELLGPVGAPATEATPAVRAVPAAPSAAGCLAALAEVWGEVLMMDPPGPEESFFELGGHSLLVGQLVTQVEEDLGAAISLRDVFDHPRLGELAALIDERLGTDRPAEALAGPVTEAVQLPASGFQERIWLAERLDPARAVYNIVLAWRLDGRLDPGTLEKSLAGLVARHEILRTRFLDEDGRLVQRIEGPWNPELEHLDLTGLPEPQRAPAVEDWLRRAARAPFDPGTGRLVRFALAELDRDAQALLVCAHHLVLDGESVQALAAELALGYAAAADGGEPQSPPPAQYRDYVTAAQEPRARAVAGASADFWVERLAGAPASLPLAPPSTPQPDGALVLELPDDLLPRLRTVGTQRTSSWFMIAATALAAALHRLTGHHDVTFAVPVVDGAGGSLPGLLGPRLGTAILRSRHEEGRTLGQLLDATRESVLLLAEHPGAPLGEVIARLAPPRSSTATPFADVMLNLNLRSAEPVAVGEALMTPLASDERFGYEAKFGLTLTLVEDRGRLRAGLSHRGDRFDAADVRRLGRWLDTLLSGFADHLGTPLEELPDPDQPAH
ncbi:condensation domain-containing protein [Kitasatospora viridis]|uniref:Phosphopantetheine binding protein n=1 Tax=Kitasatospora viridis TaxID=281105 RepID=A0A561TSV1_9ACTN|nr:condensation domain-containing protein [Kitasatospora viridis]TWF90188.1 phosphopantetheine binding protein [Kitasatospora viridis]